MIGDVLAVLLFVLLAILIARHLLRVRRWRTDLAVERARSAAVVVVASIAIASMQPRPTPPPPRDPDERRRPPTTPPFGSPVACVSDAGEGVDGGGGAMLAEPEQLQQLAGELQAIDVEHTTEGFVVGAPLR